MKDKQFKNLIKEALTPNFLKEDRYMGEMPSHLKQELDQEYFDDYELKDHPDKKDEFYALLLKHVPKGDFGHLRKEVGELFGFTQVQPGSNAGELIEYFRNLVIRGLDIQFKSNQVNEDRFGDIEYMFSGEDEKTPVLVDVWYSYHEEHGYGGVYKVKVYFNDKSVETFDRLEDAEAKYDLEGVKREETEFDVS